MDLKEQALLGDALDEHWYYLSKGAAVRSILGHQSYGSVLDVGAGSGVFAKQLLQHDMAESATCVDLHYEKTYTSSHQGKAIRFQTTVPDQPHNLMLMMDVLEHVDDDVGLIDSYLPALAAEGYVLITVPAFSFLWSGHDVFLEHRRRYTLPEIEKVIRAAGLEPVTSRYFFGLLFPLIAVIRCWRKILFRSGQLEAKSDMAVYPGWVNKLLYAIHRLEQVSLFKVNKLAGLSVVCLCRRPTKPD